MPIKRVLICDDMEDMRMLLRELVEVAGLEVAGEASDGREAVALASELQPDVVLLDICMPVMDGEAALPLILAAAPGSQVVVVSSNPASSLAGRVLELGARAYVEKGGSIMDVVAQLRGLAAAS